MPNYRIVVEIDPKRASSGRRVVSNELSAIERQANSVRTALSRAFAFAGITVGIGGLVQLADQYTNVQNRLRTVTDSTAELGAVTKELMTIANNTRSSFASTAELYTRTALAARELGLSQRETLQFTESLNQAVILSGASAQEAQAGLIQLSQGLSSGTLRGDELRSVLEQLPAVADVIAKQLGVTRGELRKMGEDGEITADKVITAFANAREELAERFGETVPTIGQSFEVLKNNIIGLTGEFLTNSGAVQALSQAVLFLAENLENIIPLITAAGVAFGAWRAFAAVSAVLGPMIALEKALGATSVAAALFSISMKGAQGAVMTFTAAIAANPLGALAVALTTIITLLYTFSDDIKVSSDGLVTLGDVAAATFDLIMESISGVTDFLVSAWDASVAAVNTVLSALGTSFSQVMSAILDFAKAAINAYIGFWMLAGKTIQLAWSNFPGFMDVIFTAVVNLGAAAAEALLNAWQVPLRGIAGALSILDDEAGAALSGFLDNLNISVPRRTASAAGEQFASDFGEAATSAFSTDYIGDAWAAIMERARARALARAAANDNGVDLDQAGVRTAPIGDDEDDKKKKKAARERRDILADWIRDTEQEIALLGMTNRERERAQEIYRLENELKRQLTITERQLVDALLDELQAARDAKVIRDYVEDLELENETLRDLLPGHEARAEALRMERDLGRELTPIERQRIIDLNEENQALNDQRDIYEQLNDRREDAIRQLAAINRLRAEGKISEGDARIAEANIGLSQDLNSLDKDLGGDYEFQAELDLIQLQQDERMRIVQDALDARLILEQEAADRRVAIEEDAQRRIRDLEAARQSVSIMAAQSTAESLASIARDLGGEQSRLYRAMFIASKAFAIADSIIKIQQGIANAMSLPFPANLAAAATVAAQAASIVSNIRAVTMQFAEGGLVSGPGTGTSDSIPARLSDGEYVVNARATSQHLGLLEAINGGRDPFLRFAAGGRVSNDNETMTRPTPRAREAMSPAVGQSSMMQPMVVQAERPIVQVRNINVLDPKMVGDYLATPEGEDAVVNIINNNPEIVRRAAGGA